MKVVDAVSIVLVHQQQIFMIQRQNSLRAFAGYSSFPGGKVDTADLDTPFLLALNNIPPRFIRAALRELTEELAFEWKNILAIHELGWAVTPDFSPHRYRTLFIKIILSEEAIFTLDAAELASGRWGTPTRFLQEFNQGKSLIVHPTVKILNALVQDIDAQNIAGLSYQYDDNKEIPLIESISGIYQFLPRSNTLPPANRTNAFIIGDCLIDPSPYTDDEFNKLVLSIKKIGFSNILITHHHLDHCERANKMALKFATPICLSQSTFKLIKQKWGAGHFNGIEVNFLQEGDTLTSWQGKEVKVFEIPGHDAGQLGLAPTSNEWFLVGDLIQGGASIVVGLPEGDMGQYFVSLQRIIDLSPAIIIPSHGIPVGGVYRLEETLQHRRLREKQIKDMMYNKNITKEEMLAKIYPDLADSIKKYAMKNIESHIKKIEEEKVGPKI